MAIEVPIHGKQPLRLDESGFTLVEILVAISVLLVGLIGVTTMTEVTSRSSVASNSRLGATTLVRRVVETARALPFRNMKSATLAADIQAQSPDLVSVTPGRWEVRRDGYVYQLEATVCRVDDDADGYGPHDTADPAFCSDSTAVGTADDQPGDYKRVTVTATWTVKSQTHTMRQVTLALPGGTGDVPAVTDVRPTAPSAPAGEPLVVTTSPSPAQIVFNATTTNKPASVSWLIDGTTRETCPPATATCTGSSNSWSFTWPLPAPTVDTDASSPNYNKCVAPGGTAAHVFDGTYQIGALPIDADGQAGTAASTPVTVNRCTPIQPPNFNATGRDAEHRGPVDTQWNANPEGDIAGYKVYRGTSPTSMTTPVCPGASTDPPIESARSCVDRNPPAYTSSALYYGVYAYDQSPNGALRPGAVSYVEVNLARNAPPKAPVDLAAAPNDRGATVSWRIPPAPGDPDSGDEIESFRVYRRAATVPSGTAWAVEDRLEPSGYDSVAAFCGGSKAPGASCAFNDIDTGGVAHQYMVTSVDSHLRESVHSTGGAPSA